MIRTEIFKLIEEERVRQNASWPDRSQYTRSAAHVLVLEGQMRKLQDEWYNNTGSIKERLLKIATVAVRALEEIKN
jgi:hypothetical protein